MTQPHQTTIRRLGPGDEEIVRKLERTIFVVAFKDAEPVGFVFGYDLPRRHGRPSILFVYELDVSPAHRRQGIATRMMNELRRIARARGTEDSFVLTEPDNAAAFGRRR